jgi:hypothetical protein
VLHIDKIGVDDAVDIIAHTLNRPCFQTTPESQAMLNNALLAAMVESDLAVSYPMVKCVVREGTAHVSIKETPSKRDKIQSHVQDLLKGHKEIKNVEVHIDPIIT